MFHPPLPNALLAQAPTLIDRLLGLSRVHWSEERAELGWRWPLPLWMWLLIALVTLIIAGWSYSRLIGPRPARTVLACVRASLLLLLVALLAGPMLVLPQERVEPDWLVMLVDRSASMGIRDTPGSPSAGNTSPGPAISRDQALQQALQQHATLFDAQHLGKDRRILWLGFDRQTFPLPAPEQGKMPEAQGDGTLLRTAILQALEKVASRPVSGIVLLTDGRSAQPTGSDLVQKLSQQAVSVFSVPLGAATAPLDLAVGRIDVPDRAFVNDQVPVNVWIEQTPGDAKIDPSRVRVKLVDAVTHQPLDTQQPRSSGLDQPVFLSGRSSVAGPLNWRVEVEYEPQASSEPELVTDNNRSTVQIEFVDRPIRVLYVEGYPRWEYRYLKTLMVREKSIQCSVLLLSADSAFAQEGDEPITRLPRNSKEFSPYDAIVIGDVPVGYFSPEQMELIRDQVSSHGAGLLWLGGALHTPRSYEASPLADLLPMMKPGAVDALDSASLPVSMEPAPLAHRLGIMRLDAMQDAGPAEAIGFWRQHLPQLWWSQNLGTLKSATETLATITRDTSAGIPVLARLRYGGGQSVYLGTDETWRWRRGRGDQYFDRFWIQLIRMIGRNRLSQNEGRLVLDVSRRRVEMEQSIVVRLRVDESRLSGRDLPRIPVTVQRQGSGPDSGLAIDRFDLLPKAAVESSNRRTGGAPNSRDYEAIWRTSASGDLLLRVTEPSMADQNIVQAIEVIRPDDELRQTAADHARLTALANDTGGKVIALDKLDDLSKVVPNRAKRTPSDVREPLWNSPLALTLVTLLLTLEWLGRKWIRLT